MKRLCVLLCLAVSVALSAPPRISGQEPGSNPLYDAQGFQPGREYLSELPFESIDTMTGNVLLTFTDLTLPGNAGFDLEIVRAYNSKAPAGWTFGLAGYPYRIDNPNGVPANIDPYTTDARPYFPRLRMPDGSRPELFSEDQYSFAVLRTQHFWRYHVNGRRLQVPDGTEAFYTAAGLLSYVQDPFGNRITVTYSSSGNLESMTQILGGQTRQVSFDGVTPPGNVPGWMSYEGRTWHYFSWTGHLLHQVTPPAGSSWQYGYDLSGMLAAVVTPHGGRVGYGFRMQLFGRDIGLAVESRVLSTRETSGAQIPPGSWSYGYSWRLGDSTSVTGPDNTRSVYEYTTPSGASEPALRIVTRDGGEHEVRAYQVRAVTSWGGGPRALLTSRAVTRDGRTYTTTLSYGSNNFADYGRPTTIQESGTLQRTTTYTFDYGFDSSRWIKDRVASQTAAMGGDSFVTSRSYNDTTGFLESGTRYGITTSFGADPAGNVERTTDAHGHITRYTYDWGVVKDTVPPLNPILRTINVDGTVASESRGGATTSFAYDALGRRTRVTPPLGHPIGTQFTTSYVRERRSDGASGGRTTATTNYLDGFGRVIGTENTQGVKTTIRYDALGHKVFESLPFEGSAEVGTAYTYDGLGRVLTLQKSGGPVTTYSYGLGGTVTIAEPNFPDTRTTLQHWGAFGDPSDRVLVGVTDAKGSVWTYQYNGLGLLTGISGGREWVYYPGTDRLQSESHPESGLTSYLYDDAGLLWIKGSPRGSLTHSYDGNHQLRQIATTYPDHTVSMDYDAAGNRILLRNAHVNSAFQYDLANRLEWRKDLIEGAVRQTTYSYNHWDEVVGIEYPSGQSVTYGYDSEGRPRSVFRNGGAVLVAEALAYHPTGAIKTLRVGNGITEQFGFDANRYWPTTIAGGPVSLTYQYDQVGNVSFITNPTNASLNQGFLYDRLDRVTTILNFGWNVFQYDGLGNRTWKEAGGLTYHYDFRNRLAMVTSAQPHPEVGAYTFDDAGRLRADPSGTYTYTPFDMLEVATVGGATTVYRYDGDSLRKIRITPEGTHYFIHGTSNVLLSEYSQPSGAQQATWARDYIYLGSRLVASVSVSNPGATVSIEGAAAVSESVGTVSLTVRLSTPAPLTHVLTVSFAGVSGTATAGADFAASGTVTFSKDSVDGATRTVVASIVDDALNEAWESFSVRLGTPVHGTLGASTAASITIDDNDPLPIMSVNSTPTSEGRPAAFTIALSTPSGRTVSVHYVSGDLSTAAADYVSLAGVATLPAGVTEVTISTPTWRDGRVEADESFRLTLTNPDFATLSQAFTDMTIVDERPADFNGDGIPELLWQRADTNQVAVWWMQPTVTLDHGSVLNPPTEQQVPVDPEWNIVGAADFNSDGRQDYLWRHHALDRVAVWFMDGLDRTAFATIEGSQNGWRIAATQDFNHDGHPDIVWHDPASGNVLIWEMGGLNSQQQPDGTVLKAKHPTYIDGVDAAWQIVGSGRFTYDENIDLLWQNRTTGQLIVWEMAGFTRIRGTYLPDYVTDVNYWVTATGDFNRDGVTDLVWRHQTEQRCVAYWVMQVQPPSLPDAPAPAPTRLSNGCVADPSTDFNWQIVAAK